MQEKVVLFIPTNIEANPSWVLLDDGNQILETKIESDPAELASITDGRRVTVIVPAGSVLITKINMPKMNAARLLKALPYAIEEHLIDDVETLHMAVSPQGDNGEVAVVTASKVLMQQWQALLATWSVRADSILPLVLALPLKEKAWTVGVAEMVVVRINAYEGFVCDQENMMTYISAALSGGNPSPELIDIINTSKKAVAETLKVTSEVKESSITPEKWLDSIAIAGVSHSSINLLQGRFSPRRSSSFKFGVMRKAAIGLAATCAALLLLTPFISYVMLKHRNNQLQSAIRAIYKQQFPNAKQMVAPKMRMTDKMQHVEAKIGQNRLLLLLGYLGRGLSNNSGIKLKQLNYQGKQVVIELTATDSDNFSKFSDYLTNIGLNVQQQNAVLSGARINATLSIE